MNKGGYSKIKRGIRPDLQLPDDPRPVRHDSGWMANVERWFKYLLEQKAIYGYQSEWVDGERGAHRYNFLTNPVGNGSSGIDFAVGLTREKKCILPCFDVVWDEPKPHGEGYIEVLIEVKGLLMNGGRLRYITEDDLDKLAKAERAGNGRENSALKLRRMREKYPHKNVWVVGGREYQAIKAAYAERIPNWED